MKKYDVWKAACTVSVVLCSISMSLAQQNEIGTIEGNLGVSSSGAAVYTIPIEIPPGRLGMQPSLALVYNSQSPGNIMGQGWGLAGFSSITRTNPTHYYNGHNDNIDFTNDQLLLDGKHLIKTGEEDGNIIYRTEVDEISKIILHRDNGTFHWFEVKTKSGLTKEYGNAVSSRQVYLEDNAITPLVWHLNRVYDKKGNTIEYRYVRNISFGELHPDKIVYTMEKDNHGTAFYTIDFDYDSLSEDLQQTAWFEKNGNKYLNKNSLRLRAIAIVGRDHPGEPIKEYNLDYHENKSITEEYFLKSVSLKAKNKALNPTIFGWDFYRPEYLCEKITTEKDSLFGATHQGHLSMTRVDWNGDMKDEIAVCKAIIENDHPKTVLSFFKGSSETRVILAENDMIFSDLQAVDINLNGDDELVVDMDQGFKIFDIRQEGSGFELPEIYHYSPSGDPNIGDFNGDGIPDCLLTRSDKAMLLIGTGSGDQESFIGDHQDEPDPPILTYESGYNFDGIADFNGDGAMDIILINKSTKSIKTFSFDVQNETFTNYDEFSYQESKKQYYADFNGDGKTDIGLAYKEEQAIKAKIYFSYGDGFYSTDQFIRSLSSAYPISADVNNDNRADFIYFTSSTSYLFEYTKADGISSTSKFYNVYLESDCFDIVSEHTIAATTLADLDGNGIKDLVIDFAETYEESNDPPKNRLHMFTFTDAGVGSNAIKTITNGWGVISAIGYQNSSSSGTTFMPGYPLIKFKSPIYLVKETFVDGGDEQRLFQKTYSFSNPVFHLNGKGFLGFIKTSIVDNTSNIRTVSEFDIHTTDIGNTTYYYHLYPGKNEQYHQPGGKGPEQLISITENTLGIKNTVDGEPKIYLPVITESLTKTWGLDGTFIRTSKHVQQLSAIDDYGNSLERTTLTDDGNPLQDADYAFTTTINNQYALNNNLQHWLVSRPESTTISKEKSGEQIDFHHKGYTYYSSGEDDWPLMKKVLELPNGNKNLQTEIHFEYDDFGHVTKKTLKAPKFEVDNEPYPVEDRIINYEYGDLANYDSRFMTNKWTEINGSIFQTRYTYDPLSGTLLSTQSPDRLTTTFVYDEFNRLTETHHPHGSVSYHILAWAEGHQHAPVDSQAIYFAESYTIGSAESTPQEKSIVFYDRYGRKLRSVRFNNDHSAIYVDRLYDTKGRLWKRSEPYFSTQNASLWTEYKYDDVGRVIQTVLPNGNAITITYQGKITSTTDQGTSVTTMKEVNAIGKVKKIIDPSGFIEYVYFSSGNIKEVNALGAKTAMTYNYAGYQSTISEPNSGLTTFIYNPFGEVIRQDDARGNEYELSYDKLGRLTEKKLVAPFEETTTYIFNDDPPAEDKTGEGYGRIKDILGSNGMSYHYFYDALSRLEKQTEVISNGVDLYEFTSQYAYEENMARLNKLTYPDGFEVGYTYADNGMLSTVSDLTHNRKLWFDPVLNPRMQITDFKLGNGLGTHKGYDIFGFPTEIMTDGVQDLKYCFDPVTGNLNWRADSLFNLIEYFGYDTELKSRLETWQVDGELEYDITYRNNGNILSKTDVTDPIGPAGTYVYDFLDKPHAVKKIERPVQPYLNSISQHQHISYTPFNKASDVSQMEDEDLRELEIIYGPDEQRKISSEYVSYNGRKELLKTRLYVSNNYEIEKDARGHERKLHYIYGGDGLVAIYELSDEVDEMHYIHKDHLGSYQAITDQEGNVIERLSFDPWGRRRNPQNWTYENVADDYRFDRGFTGHEHLDKFNLINMNGRVYDPWLGRFLSPDPFVQQPGNSQCYNRYTYAFNNPLKYVDPSGYWNGDVPRDLWLKYEGMGMTEAWHRMMGNSMMNQYNYGRFQHGYGGVASLNSFLSRSYKYNYNTGQYVNGHGSVVSYNEVFNNYIVPKSNNYYGYAAQNYYRALRGGGNFKKTNNENQDLIAFDFTEHETVGLDYQEDDPPSLQKKGVLDPKKMSFEERKEYFKRKGYNYASDFEAQGLIIGSSGDVMTAEAIILAILSIKSGNVLIGNLGLFYTIANWLNSKRELRMYYNYNISGNDLGIFYYNRFIIIGDQMLYFRDIYYANTGEFLGTIQP